MLDSGELIKITKMCRTIYFSDDTEEVFNRYLLTLRTTMSNEQIDTYFLNRIEGDFEVSITQCIDSCIRVIVGRSDVLLIQSYLRLIDFSSVKLFVDLLNPGMDIMSNEYKFKIFDYISQSLNKNT